MAGIAKKLSKEEIAEKAKKISEKLDKNPDKKDGIMKKTTEKGEGKELTIKEDKEDVS
ncbi:MAG: hypothetical protein WCG98_10005 [bacterium]